VSILGEPQSLLTEERRQQILKRLHQDGRVRSAELSDSFGVSIDTIRRDLSDLSEAGSLQRVHGGALPRSPTNASFSIRRGESRQAKETLARAAAALVRPGHVVVLDAGTTTLAIARNLPLDLKATVITNSPPAVVALAEHHGIDVHIVGGRLYRSGLAAVGAAAVEAFQSVHADICMLGVAGLHPDAGITVLDFEESYVKRAIVACAADVVAVAPVGKLDTAVAYSVGPVTALTHLITERAAPEALLAPYRALGLSILQA
jgi:DeoR/GlpR family transcriptional regulator of sugar metabolism